MRRNRSKGASETCPVSAQVGTACPARPYPALPCPALPCPALLPPSRRSRIRSRHSRTVLHVLTSLVVVPSHPISREVRHEDVVNSVAFLRRVGHRSLHDGGDSPAWADRVCSTGRARGGVLSSSADSSRIGRSHGM